ncbi:MAG TPA: cyclic nucleotide-binding domain-containing protein [Nitriliruptorales bacterium]
MADDSGLKLLARCPLFAGVLPDDLHEVARHLRRRRFRRGEVIFHQGDPGDALHIVASGSVKIVLPSAEGEEAIIATVHTGDFFGELALLDKPVRDATITATTPMRVLVVRRREFEVLLIEVPSIARKLLRGLAQRLHSLDALA